MSRILVVEDEPAILESVVYALGKAGHETLCATSLKQARSEVAHNVALVVLDLMLPDGSGFDWINELEPQRRAGLAVIVLSSRDAENDRIRALEMGADDYVTKPFSPREVVARVTAVLRRLHGRVAEPVQQDASVANPSANVTLNGETRRAYVAKTELDLTRVEFDLLALLLSRPGFVFTRPSIIDRVWGEGFALSDRTIDSHIKALRKKIVECGGTPESIETVRGVGYRAQETGEKP